MEDALKSIMLINTNCEPTKELATSNNCLAATAEANRVLEDRLCRIEFGNGQPSLVDVEDDAMYSNYGVVGGKDRFSTMTPYQVPHPTQWIVRFPCLLLLNKGSGCLRALPLLCCN
jgi:hypothetical protein